MKYTGTILDGGIGSKHRRAALVAALVAALPDVHGNSDSGKTLAAILKDAESRFDRRMARIAERNIEAGTDDVPVTLASDVPVSETTPENNPLANSRVKVGHGKGRKTRKSRKVTPTASDTVPCVSCFKQTPRADATIYSDSEAVCPSCEAEAAE